MVQLKISHVYILSHCRPYRRAQQHVSDVSQVSYLLNIWAGQMRHLVALH